MRASNKLGGSGTTPAPPGDEPVFVKEFATDNSASPPALRTFDELPKPDANGPFG